MNKRIFLFILGAILLVSPTFTFGFTTTTTQPTGVSGTQTTTPISRDLKYELDSKRAELKNDLEINRNVDVNRNIDPNRDVEIYMDKNPVYQTPGVPATKTPGVPTQTPTRVEIRR
ncbi:MAG TPA: hypothetical protein VGP47_00250 [Parachlamydiaceae bacterium]|nr:hypothetical protein [Parachlamydiaceae bacterium]